MRPVFSKYHVENLKAISSLDKAVQPLFYEFIRRIGIAGINIRITSSKRSSAQQDEEYAKGRTKPGQIVTDANDSNSYHTWGLAIDIAPLRFMGLFYITNYSAAVYQQIDYIAREIGIEHPIKGDLPHFQYSSSLSIKDLKNGSKVKVPFVKRLANKDTSLIRLEERLRSIGFDFIPSNV